MRHRIHNILLEATAFNDRPNINDAFWKWFGDSKVVDSNGYPLVVYRGSNSYHEGILTSSNVIYFAKDARIADEYAYKDTANIAPVYLCIERPAPLRVYYKIIRELEEEDDGREYSLYEYNKKVSVRFKKLGHDGIILSHDAWRDGDVKDGNDILIVFDLKQIKSIFNNGTWNPNSKDIMK
jgi:hypothetical protein